MSKKNTLLVAVLLALIAVYLVFFTNWFKPRTIRIYSSPNFQEWSTQHHAPIIFGLIGRFRLTEIKVVPLAAYQNNPMTLPVWHLISDSNSIPVKEFVYGQWIHGMRPAVRGEGPQELETNVMYRLFLSAGSFKGHHDFEIK